MQQGWWLSSLVRSGRILKNRHTWLQKNKLSMKKSNRLSTVLSAYFFIYRDFCKFFLETDMVY